MAEACPLAVGANVTVTGALSPAPSSSRSGVDRESRTVEADADREPARRIVGRVRTSNVRVPLAPGATLPNSSGPSAPTRIRPERHALGLRTRAQRDARGARRLAVADRERDRARLVGTRVRVAGCDVGGRVALAEVPQVGQRVELRIEAVLGVEPESRRSGRSPPTRERCWRPAADSPLRPRGSAGGRSGAGCDPCGRRPSP